MPDRPKPPSSPPTVSIALVGAPNAGQNQFASAYASNWLKHVNDDTNLPARIARTIDDEEVIVNLATFNHAWLQHEQSWLRQSTIDNLNAHAGVFYVYDVTRRDSFEALKAIRRNVQAVSKEGMPVALAATGVDRGREDWVVGEEEGRKAAEQWGVQFVLASEKMDLGVSPIVKDMCRSALQEREEEIEWKDNPRNPMNYFGKLFKSKK